MTHFDEGTLVRLRDGELVDADVLGHLDGCAACAALLGDARARALAIDSALGTLDVPFDTARARELVRARLAGGGVAGARGTTGARAAAAKRWSFASWQLGRAAAVLVLTAGALSALPGSPVREWLVGSADVATPMVAPASESATPDPVGYRLAVSRGPLDVRVLEATPGSTVEVVWTRDAAVTIYAPAGSAFGNPDGRVEATVGSGPVRIELPEGVTPATVRVNGSVVVRSEAGGLATPADGASRVEGGVRFVVPGD